MHYFASDIHLGAGDPDAAREVERRFVAWLDRAGRDAESIFLVGDIFDFWFEYRRVVPKGFVRTLGKLAELTDRGVRVAFLTGNHDMWVGDYLTRECGVEVYTAPQLLTLGGRRIFVAHGDNMNIDGQPMLRLLNRIFRSRTLRWLFSWGVHPDWAMRFGHWWSGKSRKRHNDADRRAAETGGPGGFDASLTEPLIAYARSYAATHEVDDFVFGHMHFARDYRDGALHVVHLGCWEKNPAYAVLDNRGVLSLRKLEEEEPLPAKTEHDETVSRLAAAYQGRRGGAGRPHRDRHEGDLRTSDALRPGGGLPAADHQTGLSQGGDPRTVVVPARRYEYPLSGRTGGPHLGQRRIPLL